MSPKLTSSTIEPLPAHPPASSQLNDDEDDPPASSSTTAPTSLLLDDDDDGPLPAHQQRLQPARRSMMTGDPPCQLINDGSIQLAARR